MWPSPRMGMCFSFGLPVATKLAIGAGDSSNIVTGLIGESNSVKDAADQNENCTNNTWTNNEFSTVSPSCIH
jgi:hypothetical protein